MRNGRPRRNARYQLKLYVQMDYQRSTEGRTPVPSARTASSFEGSILRALSIVGATWAVPTSANTDLASKLGLESSSMTLVSSWAKPPCSASFLLLPV